METNPNDESRSEKGFSFAARACFVVMVIGGLGVYPAALAYNELFRFPGAPFEGLLFVLAPLSVAGGVWIPFKRARKDWASRSKDDSFLSAEKPSGDWFALLRDFRSSSLAE